MEWKEKIDECCADELEEMIIDSVRAGFLPDSEIFEQCREYIEEDYPDDADNITEEELSEVIAMYRGRYENAGEQKNFLKLDSVFRNLEKQGIVSLHCAGYVQTDGFDDCNEIAAKRHENGEKVIGCCFYTMQDLEHILHEESTSLLFSFGSYADTPTAEEIGRIIVRELEAAGFSTQWTQNANTKIEVKDFIWDKRYSGDEYGR